jgi:exosome complex exonuclease DIS3/RRP44
VGQALKGHVVVEEGFVMRVFSNGFVVFVPRFGVEGLIRLRELGVPEPHGEFDGEKYVLEVTGSRNVVVELFQKIRVRISDEVEQSTGKRKIKMELVD